MSFAGQVKQELSRQTATARHCRIAELAALLSFCGTVQIDEEEQITLSLRTEQEVVCGVFLQLLKKVFRIGPDRLHYEEQIRARSSVYCVEIVEQEDVVQILQALGIMNDDKSFRDEAPLTEQPFLKRACCRRAWLGGAFLAAGVVSDPSRSYHFEYVCRSREEAEQMAAVMASLGIQAAVSRRGRHFLAYVKEGSQISDLLGMMGASVAMLDFENARIVREVRGNINRKVNCETANIRKTADASADQIGDIRFIEKILGPGSLPTVLDETARIRLQYPTATLQELGELMDPPVGKSGINHRLRRISGIAERLRAEQGGEEHVE